MENTKNVQQSIAAIAEYLKSADLNYVKNEKKPKGLYSLHGSITPHQARWVLPEISGCRFSTIDESIAFLLERDERLTSDMAELGAYPWCLSGWYLVPAKQGYNKSDKMVLWYQTTRETLIELEYYETTEGEELTQIWVYIPRSRDGGNHSTFMTRVDEGMTEAMHKKVSRGAHLMTKEDYTEWYLFNQRIGFSIPSWDNYEALNACDALIYSLNNIGVFRIRMDNGAQSLEALKSDLTDALTALERLSQTDYQSVLDDIARKDDDSADIDDYDPEDYYPTDDELEYSLDHDEDDDSVAVLDWESHAEDGKVLDWESPGYV